MATIEKRQPVEKRVFDVSGRIMFRVPILAEDKRHAEDLAANELNDVLWPWPGGGEVRQDAHKWEVFVETTEPPEPSTGEGSIPEKVESWRAPEANMELSWWKEGAP